MTAAFQPLTENPDLSVHPNPAALWNRIAVVCRWKNAHTFRERVPDAAIVGPLRTTRGIDLFVRSLLANPQIRQVVIGGPDLTPGETTTAALMMLWEGHRDARRYVGSDIPDELIARLIREVELIHRPTLDESIRCALLGAGAPFAEDRPSGRHVFPVRPPEATSIAPAGDSGQRVAGRTVSDVWPRVLSQILDFGIEVPSKHGNTKELLGLISVIRDPAGTIAEIEAGMTSYRMTPAELEEYTRRISTDYAPTDDAYSYGSRMARQFEPFRQRFGKSPDDRGLFLTPWIPDDASAGGRPCLVGVQFRVLDGRLSMFVNFRSHDMFAAYPQNLAALCSWLCREARESGHAIGTLQVMSVSAHLYDRDWNDARAVVSEDRPDTDWDQRSTFLVEVVSVEADVKIRATALTPDGRDVVRVFEAGSAIGLRGLIDRSGLVTSIGAALWLGEELAKADARVTDEYARRAGCLIGAE